MEFDFNALLALAFGAWAGVVGFIGHGIRSDLRAIGQDLKDESRRLNQYIVQTEKRLVLIEDHLDLNGGKSREVG